MMVELMEFCGPGAANWKFGWLKALNTSARSSIRRVSPKGIFFRRAKSTFFSPGPSRLLRLTFPNDPGAGLANAQVLKNVPGTHGFELALTPGTKSGRC